MTLPKFTADSSLHQGSSNYFVASIFHQPGTSVRPQFTCKNPVQEANCVANCPDAGNCYDLPPLARAACMRAALQCALGCFHKWC